MDYPDQLTGTIREAERLLAPLRDYGDLVAHVSQLTGHTLETERVLNTCLPQYPTSLDRLIELTRSLDHIEIASKGLNFPTIVNDFLGPWQESSLKSLLMDSSRLPACLSGLLESARIAEEQILQVLRRDELFACQAIDPIRYAAVAENFRVLSSAYGKLDLSACEDSNIFRALPPLLYLGPPSEMVGSALLVDSLHHSQSDARLNTSTNHQVARFDETSGPPLEELLAHLDPSLSKLWIGANRVRLSGNPDRQRHVATSLRELVTQVLHTIAPDDQVHAWTKEPHHFHDGRPTRMARLLFICRDYDHGPFADFVQADVKASLSVIQLLHKGTHSVETPFSEEQLTALITRTGQIIRFLFHLYEEGD